MTPKPNGKEDLHSMAEALLQQSEQLRKLAAQLEARQQELAEMEASYPYLRAYAYAKLREEFARNLVEIPNDDLEAYARDTGAVPLDSFINELKGIPEKN